VTVEASVAVDGGAGTADAGAGGGQESAAPDQFAPLMDRLEQGLGDITSRLEALTPAEQEAAQGDPAAAFEQEFADLFGAEDEPAAQGLDPKALQAVIDQMVEQRLAPVAQQTQDLRLEYEVKDLEARIPALQDPGVRQQAFDHASQLAERMGIAPSVALVEVAYKASKFDAMAQSEVPAGGEHVGLEGGGGAAPNSPDADVAGRIVAAGGNRTPFV
jgi:hypothetical protein